MFTVHRPRVLLVWAAVFGVLVAAAVIRSGNAADVVIGAAIVGLNALMMALITRRIGMARLEFAGWSITSRPAIGRTRAFDTRDVVAIRRWRNRAGGYRIRLQGGEGGRRGARAQEPSR